MGPFTLAQICKFVVYMWTVSPVGLIFDNREFEPHIAPETYLSSTSQHSLRLKFVAQKVWVRKYIICSHHRNNALIDINVSNLLDDYGRWLLQYELWLIVYALLWPEAPLFTWVDVSLIVLLLIFWVWRLRRRATKKCNRNVLVGNVSGSILLLP